MRRVIAHRVQRFGLVLRVEPLRDRGRLPRREAAVEITADVLVDLEIWSMFTSFVHSTVYVSKQFFIVRKNRGNEARIIKLND